MTRAPETAGVCIANIGPRERRKRMSVGVALLVAGGATAVVLIGFGMHRLWRLLLFFPLWAGVVGVLQAKEKT